MVLSSVVVTHHSNSSQHETFESIRTYCRSLCVVLKYLFWLKNCCLMMYQADLCAGCVSEQVTTLSLQHFGLKIWKFDFDAFQRSERSRCFHGLDKLKVEACSFIILCGGIVILHCLSGHYSYSRDPFPNVEVDRCIYFWKWERSAGKLHHLLQRYAATICRLYLCLLVAMKLFEV